MGDGSQEKIGDSSLSIPEKQALSILGKRHTSSSGQGLIGDELKLYACLLAKENQSGSPEDQDFINSHIINVS